MYPVQGNDAIIFTDGQGIFLKFDGWHFTEVRGYWARDMELTSGRPEIVGFDYGTSDHFRLGLAIAHHHFARHHGDLVDQSCRPFQHPALFR